MTAITVELPGHVAEQLRERRVSEESLQIFIVEVVEAWLSASSDKRRFAESAVPFARHLIATNRALFEELAQR